MTLGYNILSKMKISLILLIFSIVLYAENTNSVINSKNNLAEAASAFNRRDYRTAIEFYEKVLETSPVVNIDCFINLSKSYIALGDYKQAIVVTRRGIRFNSVISWDIYYQQGYAFYKLKDYRNAIISVERALDVNESAYLYNFLGLMYIYTEDYNNAQENFLLAITYNPRNATFLCNLAATYEMQRNFNEALQTYERAAQFDTENETHAKREANRIKNYLATRNSLPRDVADNNNFDNITSSTNTDNVGIIEDVESISIDESNTNDVVENTQ